MNHLHSHSSKPRTEKLVDRCGQIILACVILMLVIAAFLSGGCTTGSGSRITNAATYDNAPGHATLPAGPLADSGTTNSFDHASAPSHLGCAACHAPTRNRAVNVLWGLVDIKSGNLANVTREKVSGHVGEVLADRGLKVHGKGTDPAGVTREINVGSEVTQRPDAIKAAGDAAGTIGSKVVDGLTKP